MFLCAYCIAMDCSRARRGNSLIAQGNDDPLLRMYAFSLLTSLFILVQAMPLFVCANYQGFEFAFSGGERVTWELDYGCLRIT